MAAGTVGRHREDHKVVDHPVAGPIAVDCDVLSDGDADFKIVILTASAGADLAALPDPVARVQPA